MKIIKLNNPEFNRKYINELISKNICFIGVFSKLCIHCKNMKPEWEKLKHKLKKFNCNAILLEIDSSYLYSLGNNNLLKQVNGLPTILIYKNNKLIKEYNGNRTNTDILNFFKPYLVLTNNKKTIKNKYCKYKNKSCKKNKNLKK